MAHSLEIEIANLLADMHSEVAKVIGDHVALIKCRQGESPLTVNDEFVTFMVCDELPKPDYFGPNGWLPPSWYGLPVTLKESTKPLATQVRECDDADTLLEIYYAASNRLRELQEAPPCVN